MSDEDQGPVRGLTRERLEQIFRQQTTSRGTSLDVRMIIDRGTMAAVRATTDRGTMRAPEQEVLSPYGSRGTEAYQPLALVERQTIQLDFPNPPQRFFETRWLRGKIQLNGHCDLIRESRLGEGNVLEAAHIGQTLQRQTFALSTQLANNIKARVQVNVTPDISQRLANALKRNAGDPYRFATELLSGSGISQAIGRSGQPRIGFELDPDFCFVTFQFPTVKELSGAPYSTKLKFTGYVTFKIGLSPEAWQRIAQNISESGPLAVQTFVRFASRLGVSLWDTISMGTRLAAADAAELVAPYLAGFLVWAGFVAIVAGLTYGSTRLMMYILQRAHQAGLELGAIYQYAEGYVYLAFAQNADDWETATREQYGRSRRSLFRARIRGVDDAIEDVRRAGGGVQGQRVIQRFLCIDMPPLLNQPRARLNPDDPGRGQLLPQVIESFDTFLTENLEFIHRR